ncbi:cytochrome b/b6 domain-containing protein [Pedobacter sp. KBS0701]|uniref:cytochrome b/b6 domain-containing protein n=1 Tax=Pedobacter sp. KBS0701 TaxID=2578106 RepID=UPI00110F1C02|nr:cytochrome b/b6 domain-containing protein [Pedobacter sp. KBS0701]QDW23372.1 cytochrome b/b6 domain-containing protein [Pedobacter sp. KBS0701]
MIEKRFNLASRVIHWAIAFAIIFLLLTVFLRLGWMNKDAMGEILKETLQKKGIQLSKADAAAIGKEIRGPMWSYHILAGYVLIGLYLIRMGITFIQGIAFKNPFLKQTSPKDKFKSWLYIIFYALFATSLFTGFMVVNGPKEAKEIMEAIHVKSLYYMLSFIVLHIGGVLLADIGGEPGIVSKMIRGDFNINHQDIAQGPDPND